MGQSNDLLRRSVEDSLDALNDSASIKNSQLKNRPMDWSCSKFFTSKNECFKHLEDVITEKREVHEVNTNSQ